MMAIPAPAIVGPLGPAQLACIRSWSRRAYRVLFVHLTPTAGGSRLLKGLVDSYLRLKPDQLLHADGAEQLADYLAENNATAVSAVSYNLIRRLHQLKHEWPSDVLLWTVDPSILPFLESKRDQISLAEKKGLSVAQTVEVTPACIDSIPTPMFPLVLRPNRPDSVAPYFKVELIPDRPSLIEFLGRFSRLEEPLVAQPFIDGKNYVVHGARCSRTGRIIQAGFEVASMFEGVTLALRQSSLPSDLMEACERFCHSADIKGVYHFDFRRDANTGRYYFLEVNGRMGGTTAKVYRLGFDEPGLMADSFLGNESAEPKIDIRAVASSRQALIKASWYAVRGRLSVFDYPRPGLVRYLTTLGAGFLLWRDELYSIKEWRTSLAYLLGRFAG